MSSHHQVNPYLNTPPTVLVREIPSAKGQKKNLMEEALRAWRDAYRLRISTESAMSDLRKRIIRLAYEKPELRQDLLPLLKESKEKYPWDKCIADQMEQYGSKEKAEKVCGKIYWTHGPGAKKSSWESGETVEDGFEPGHVQRPPEYKEEPGQGSHVPPAKDRDGRWLDPEMARTDWRIMASQNKAFRQRVIKFALANPRYRKAALRILKG